MDEPIRIIPLDANSLYPYETILKLAEKQLKHQQTLKECIKKYQQNHKNDPHYKEINREKSKRFYEKNKDKFREKYLSKKMGEDVYKLMQISV
jgi:hypothetical protein